MLKTSFTSAMTLSLAQTLAITFEPLESTSLIQLANETKVEANTEEPEGIFITHIGGGSWV